MATRDEEVVSEHAEEVIPSGQAQPSSTQAQSKLPAERDEWMETAIWAARRASYARVLGLEWLALGLALAAGHLLFVAVPRTTLTLLDLFIVILTAGGGLFMYGFELHRGSALRELSERLAEEWPDDRR